MKKREINGYYLANVLLKLKATVNILVNGPKAAPKSGDKIMMKNITHGVCATIALGAVLSLSPAYGDDDAIMDVDDNAAAFTGTWPQSQSKILYYGDDYQYAWGSGSSTTTAEAVWTTERTADVTGEYQIFVRWTTHPNREESAIYRVYDGVADNSVNCSCSKNQTLNGGAWQYCCSTTLHAGNKGVVKLGNENTNTDEVVIADGVRFVRAAVDGGDIVNSSVTSSDILNSTIRDYDIGDEPGLDWTGRNVRNLAVSSNCAATTNLASFTLTAPTSGYVHVNTSGIYVSSTSDRWVRVCISDVSGGNINTCDSLAPFMETQITSAYERELRFAVHETFSVAAGSKTYYLKACQESGATGNIQWDDFTGIFVPTRY